MSLILSNAVFLEFHDWRWVGKNILDTTPPTAASLSDLLDVNSPAGGRLARLISVSEERLFAAVVVADRYSVQDVVTYGGNLAQKIVADLTVGPLLERRDRATTDQQRLSLAYDQAEAYLEALRRGERIFYQVPFVPESGLPEAKSTNPIPGIDPPLITQRASRVFGEQLGQCWPGYNGWPNGGCW